MNSDSDLKRLEAAKEAERIKRSILTEQLDSIREMSNHQLAVRAKMGDTHSFITSVSLGWIVQHVQLAGQLPIWKGKKDQDDRIIIDENTLEELRQREPDWRRQLPMVKYIALREHHKFPPILVAAWQEWVDNPNADEWIDKLASKNSVTEMALDSKASFIDIDCENTNFFVLDGQHRVMALRGLKQLSDDGLLQAKNETGSNRQGITLTIDEITEEMDRLNPDHEISSQARIQSLMHESIGIEIIPAVLKDETYIDALQRLRSVFVHVNRTAKALPKGVLAQLDEDDGFAIVARRVMVKHDLLRHKRVEPKKDNLNDSSKEYTTLVTLTQIAKMFLGIVSPYSHWKAQTGTLPFRPLDSELDLGLQQLIEYFDKLSELPSHNELIQDHEKSCADYRKDDGDNILFRPIAQQALAKAIGIMVSERGISLDSIIGKLTKAEKDGKLLLRNKKSVWFGVLCDVINMKMRRQKGYQDLCTLLLIHFLGTGTPEDERNMLEKQFRLARKINDDTCVGLNGTNLSPSNLHLPSPW